MDDPLVLIIFAFVALLAAAIGVIVYRRNRPAEEEEMLRFNCPGCGRRLRYRPTQAGHHGACPRCRETFVFPGAAGPSKSR
jgi:hypothetical protein